MGIFDNWVDPREYWKQHGFWGGLEQAGLLPPQRQNLLNQPIGDAGTQGILQAEAPIESIQKHFPDNPAAWAAILATIERESGGFHPHQEELGGGGGYGLFQFTGDQKESYHQWRRNNNKSDNADTQIEYFKHLIYDSKPTHDIGAGHRQKLRDAFQSNDPNFIADQITRRYERPANIDDEADLRGNLADAYYRQYEQEPQPAPKQTYKPKPIAHKPPQAYNTQPVGYAPAPLPPQPSFGRSGGLLPDMETAVRYSQWLQKQARRNRV